MVFTITPFTSMWSSTAITIHWRPSTICVFTKSVLSGLTFIITLGVSILGHYEKGVDFFEDSITETIEEGGKLTNFVDSKTNVGYNVNGYLSYDIITVGGERTVIIH